MMEIGHAPVATAERSSAYIYSKTRGSFADGSAQFRSHNLAPVSGYLDSGRRYCELLSSVSCCISRVGELAGHGRQVGTAVAVQRPLDPVQWSGHVPQTRGALLAIAELPVPPR